MKYFILSLMISLLFACTKEKRYRLGDEIVVIKGFYRSCIGKLYDIELPVYPDGKIKYQALVSCPKLKPNVELPLAIKLFNFEMEPLTKENINLYDTVYN